MTKYKDSLIRAYIKGIEKNTEIGLKWCIRKDQNDKEIHYLTDMEDRRLTLELDKKDFYNALNGMYNLAFQVGYNAYKKSEQIKQVLNGVAVN